MARIQRVIENDDGENLLFSQVMAEYKNIREMSFDTHSFLAKAEEEQMIKKLTESVWVKASLPCSDPSHYQGRPGWVV